MCHLFIAVRRTFGFCLNAVENSINHDIDANIKIILFFYYYFILMLTLKTTISINSRKPKTNHLRKLIKYAKIQKKNKLYSQG